jgi:hypothetical protein
MRGVRVKGDAGAPKNLAPPPSPSGGFAQILRIEREIDSSILLKI